MAMDKDNWNDISDEMWREYIYSDSVFRVDSPSELHVSQSSLGGHAHRIKTADGLAYYVAPGWKAICWAVEPGRDLFKF